MKRHQALAVALTLGTMMSPLNTWAQSQEPSAVQPPLKVNPRALDYFNDRPVNGAHRPWGLFLGMGATLDERNRVLSEIKAGVFLNPFTGQPFKREEVEVFVFGHEHLPVEVARVVTDHLEVHVLSSWEDLKGKQFDFVICHSNGCPNALDAQRYGVIWAKHFFTLGTDWTLKDLKPGDLRGADLTRFVMKGDIVPKLPAPGSTRAGEAAFAYQFTLRFGGSPGVNESPFISLDPPPGQHADLQHPVRPHALQDSHFTSIQQWMHQEGPQQTAIAQKIGITSSPSLLQQMHRTAPLDRRGKDGDPSVKGIPSPSLSREASPSPYGISPRGGIAAGVTIRPDDFQSR